MTYSPWWILTSLALIVLFIFLHYRNFKPKFIFPSSKLSQTTYWLTKILVGLILVCIILLPLHLGFVSGKKTYSPKATPVQVLLDVSLSMAATDVSPSRFSVAKSHVIDMVSRLEGYTTSLISFSGIPFISLPFSDDTPAMLQSLKDLSLDDFPAASDFLGTALGDALLLGVSNIHRLSADQPWMILLITDGDNNKGYDPADIFPLLLHQRIAVWVLAIGQSDYLIGYDQYHEPVLTSINIPLLETIAQQTSWAFLNVLATGDMQAFFDDFFHAVTDRELASVDIDYRYMDTLLFVILAVCLFVLLSFHISFMLQYLKKKQN